MRDRECVSCIKRKTPYCPTSMECMATEDMPYYQNRMMLLKENQELKQKYLNAVADYETTMAEKNKLKKQLEKWKHHLKCSKEMLDIQGQKGNYDYDEYMLGLYNGMEYIISLFETREPNYINGKDVEFTNNKTQQKEFIKYLEAEINKCQSNIFADGVKYGFQLSLSKYKEIIGDDNK